MAGIANSAESVLAQTDRILGSPHFARSQTLSRFLRFIVEVTLDGKANELKEYRLGVDVLGRGKNFDPRIDPIVRMQAAKLRSRLAEYYDNEGRGDPIVISIPKGGYVPTFTSVEISRPAPGRDISSQQVQSIAVLPFVSMSGDPENEYFSDGLTEELINVLTYVPGLRVVARTSAFCFKNAVKDIREIGAQLNVRTVLEGSVRKAGKQLRVTAQLVDVSTGYHLLSQTFRREMNDVFAVQEELAGAVVTEIMPQFRGESRPLVRNYTADLDAYQLYLKGMFTVANSFIGPKDSVEVFRQVLDHDPSYAPAWAGLAYAYCLQSWYEMMPSKLAMPLGKHAALRALELDHKLGLGYAALGMAQTVLDWNWPAAEQSFQKCIEIQPGLALAHEFYAYTCLMPQGRFQEAVQSTKRALDLNPLDPVLCGGATFTYATIGDYAAALRQHESGKQVNPNHPLVYGGIGTAYEMEGRLEEALAAYRKASELSGRAAYPTAAMGHVLAKLGDLPAAHRILDELLSSSPQGYCLSLLYLGLGNTLEATRWFERAMGEREPHALTATFDPRFRPLREEREFRRLLDQMGLSQSVTA